MALAILKTLILKGFPLRSEERWSLSSALSDVLLADGARSNPAVPTAARKTLEAGKLRVKKGPQGWFFSIDDGEK